MPKVRKSATTIAEFIEWTEQIAELFTVRGQYEVPWFRGTTSSKYKLVPSLYRSASGREPDSDDELRAEFKRRGLPLVAERPPRDDWEWYFLMQHYGAPTRLLDWTDSALVALYFAVSSYSVEGNTTAPMTPAVWALNPWQLNKKTEDEFIGPVTPGVTDISKYLGKIYELRKPPRYPIALDPTFVGQRMLVQHSHFTLHGHDHRGIEEMETELGLEGRLFKLVIRSEDESIAILRQRVALLGISETTIFPDLNGLGRELRLEYDVF